MLYQLTYFVCDQRFQIADSGPKKIYGRQLTPE